MTRNGWQIKGEYMETITAIATESAGGPMAALEPLVGKLAGVELIALSGMILRYERIAC